MKELIKDLVTGLINPKQAEQKKNNLKYELQVKFDKSLYLKDYLKSRAWLEYDKPKVYEQLETGVRRLIYDGTTMSEIELKSILSYMKAIKDRFDLMRNDIATGEEAGIKLEKMK